MLYHSGDRKMTEMMRCKSLLQGHAIGTASYRKYTKEAERNLPRYMNSIPSNTELDPRTELDFCIF